MNRTLLLLFFLAGSSQQALNNSDDSLPIYMRGMKWEKVEEYRRQDLSLSKAVVPYKYIIELDVNVRGHAGATRSDFSGIVSIFLNFTEPADKIELHSSGLIIDKAVVSEYRVMSKAVGVSEISWDMERKIDTIHLNRTIKPEEEFMLVITYHGIARMDEYGLFENWDPKFNKSLDSNSPFILATNNFPAGARNWFPCFDEPEKRAKFVLNVKHPSGMNAYSNADVDETRSLGNGRTLTIFKTTDLISTYQVALSINHLSSQYLIVNGFGKVRLIMSQNSNPRSLPPTYWTDWQMNYSEQLRKDYTFDVPNFIRRNLESLVQTGLEIPRNKLDIIILEGTNAQSVQPGLVTIGRYNLLLNAGENSILATEFRNLTQLLIGNRISVRETNQIWLNDIFSYILFNETETETDPMDAVPDLILHASLHERALKDLVTYQTENKQFLTSRDPLPSLKASHLLKLLGRFCPGSFKSIRDYIAEHIGGFASIDNLINTLTKSCKNPEVARPFLEDYINQPGKALLVVKRVNDTVTVKQTRYHSTYFDTKLRDNQTRYTLPIFFTVDGKSNMKVFDKNEPFLSIKVPSNLTFLIDHEYDHLYLVFYEDTIPSHERFMGSDREKILHAVQKSSLAALSIGFVSYETIQQQWKAYATQGLFRQTADLRVMTSKAMDIAAARDEEKYRESRNHFACIAQLSSPSWDGLFNNDTKYWEFDSKLMLTMDLQCIQEWNNSTSYMSFLDRHFLGKNSAISPYLISHLAQYDSRTQWRDLHRFFFRNAGICSNHRFDLLAEAVLKRMHLGRTMRTMYPDMAIRDDYLKEMRDFVIENPRRAASMATEIERRMELEYVRDALPKYHNTTINAIYRFYASVYGDFK